MIKISVPLFIILPRKTKADRKMYLNLNNYRNWHYIVSNIVKQKFNEGLENSLKGLKFNKKLDITYILYKGSKRKIDRANILCIIEKFFCDALTNYDCIADDNDEYLSATHYYGGGVDTENPRVEIIIEEIQ
jgi:Holliday junction resolvase RusA-like endonuclease